MLWVRCCKNFVTHYLFSIWPSPADDNFTVGEFLFSFWLTVSLIVKSLFYKTECQQGLKVKINYSTLIKNFRSYMMSKAIDSYHYCLNWTNYCQRHYWPCWKLEQVVPSYFHLDFIPFTNGDMAKVLHYNYWCLILIKKVLISDIRVIILNITEFENETLIWLIFWCLKYAGLICKRTRREFSFSWPFCLRNCMLLSPFFLFCYHFDIIRWYCSE